MNDKKPRGKPKKIIGTSTTRKCSVEGCKREAALSEDMCSYHKKRSRKARRSPEFERAKPKQQRRKSRI
ncbi:MAG: hypothetical protein LBC64_04630 [Fibromonadaceae bacterium]|jgi:hypothetical protein|nr:hypothetical protein [Fibromonadaceae bacterium]